MGLMRIIVVLLIGFLAAAPAWAQNGVARSEPRPNAVVDPGGNTDPTKNVDALVKALEEKTRELRDTDLKQAKERIDFAEKFNASQLLAAEKLNNMRFDLAAKLAEAVDKRIDSEAKIRAELSDKLAVAEKDRINAIRAVDVAASAELGRRTSEAAVTLQASTTSIAEALRSQAARLADDLRALVSSTAATALQTQQQQFSEVGKRLTTLEQVQSEGRGKAGFQDPAIVTLTEQVRILAQRGASTAGTDSGRSDMFNWILAALGALIAGAVYLRGRADPRGDSR